MIWIFGEAAAALREVFSPAFRSAALKILGLTAGILLILGSALQHWLAGLVTLPSSWAGTLLAVVEGLGLAVGSIFLVAPVSALVAGFFVDDLAAQVERDIDPSGPEGRPLPLARALWLSVRFAALSLVVLVVALLLLFVPGVNAVAFLGANAYLAGRQYFEFAALRFHPERDVAARRRANGGPVYLGGFCIALFLSVPILNLLAPLFGTALMVRINRRLEARRPLAAPAP